MNTTRRAGARGHRRRRRWSLSEIRVSDPAELRCSIKGTAVGNFMEWYDFGVYGYIATTLARVFYPGDSASAGSLLATFGTLTAAFAVRPVGGFIFGPLGDRIGRKKVLEESPAYEDADGDQDTAGDGGGQQFRRTIIGGTTPLIAEALISGTGNLMVPAYLLMAAGLIGMVALLFTPEVAGKRLPGSAPSVENEGQARDLAEGRPVG